MKKSSFMMSVAALGLSTGAMLYTYCKMNPVKSQIAMNKAKDMMNQMKDF